MKPPGWMLSVLIVVATLTLESGEIWFIDRDYFSIKHSGHWFAGVFDCGWMRIGCGNMWSASGRTSSRGTGFPHCYARQMNICPHLSC